jgi:hypothetical protein
MRKIALIMLSLLFFVSVVVAQSSRVDFGLKAGTNLSALKTGDQLSDHRTGYYAGALAHIHLDKHFALQPEVIYSSQGAEYSSTSKTKLNYINVPVMGQYMFGNGLRLQTGPQVGFLTSAKSEGGNEETSIKNSFKNADVSWTFGASYLTNIGLGLDARYNFGINDISKSNTDLKNRVWQLGLFYQLK